MDLRPLEPYFWRAPSAHNTQPWELRYRQSGAEVGWDGGRALPDGDPTGRDLRLSLGAFVECCLVVCAGAGIAAGFWPDHSEAGRRVGYLVAAPRLYPTPFGIEDVTARQTSRVAYQPGPLCDAVAGSVRDLAEEAGAQALLVPCRSLAGPLARADRHQFGSPAVVAELRSWLRLTHRHPAYAKDGLTDQALALSRAEAYGLRAALALYRPLRRAGLPRALAAASRGLLDYDGQAVVLVAPRSGGGPAGEVAMGRVLMRQWLALSRAGYATHPLSQLIDCPATRSLLAGRLGVDDPARLVSVYRAGRPAGPTVRSARITGVS
jgi:hypothetical protein